VPVVEDFGAWKVVAKLTMSPSQNGQQRAQWEMSVVRPNGTIAGRSRYASALPVEASGRVIAALTQSAIDVNALALVDWLEDPMRNVASINYSPLVER
jgi:hypothetical protein